MRSGPRVARRHRSGAGGARHQRRAPPQAAAHRAQARRPFLYTDRRLLERIGGFADAAPAQADLRAPARARASLIDELDRHLARRPRRTRCAPGDVAFIQFSSGSTSDAEGRRAHARQPHRQPARRHRGGRASTTTTSSLSWMPLTHDMGLIGLHIFMFANRVHMHLMPTELFVRRPLLWLQFAARRARHDPVLAELRLPPLSQGAGRAAPRRRSTSPRCA